MRRVSVYIIDIDSIAGTTPVRLVMNEIYGYGQQATRRMGSLPQQFIYRRARLILE
jgi:hypothetical protein